MHVVALPVVEKEIRWSKRCKDPALVGTVKEVIHQISHSKKWASEKVTDENGQTQFIKSYSLLQDRFYEFLRDAGFDGFERGERGSTAEHLSVIEYKTKKEAERLEQIQEAAEYAITETVRLNDQKEAAEKQARQAQAQLDKVAPKFKAVEELAEKYSDDAETVLPETGTLESARNYREKKAKPVFDKIIKVLHGLYRKYMDLVDRFNDLTRKHQRLQERYERLDASFERLADENGRLKQVEEDFDTLCRGIGAERVMNRVNAIRERESAERQKRQTSCQQNRNASVEMR